ncbi:hypothetical protein CL634_01795 [bacterium]|nr:hypothetical protein [bacterium]
MIRVKKALKKVVKKIKDDGHKYGITFELEETDDTDSLIISNKKSRKAVLIGEVEINSQKIIVSFLINIHKWAWAEAEGFTRNEIIDKFSKEVFTEIKIEKVVENLI